MTTTTLPAARSRLPALAVTAGLLALAFVVAAPTASAATDCSDDPSDVSVSVRPHVLQGLEGPPLVASSIVAPFGDEVDCQTDCPSRPALNAWVSPESLGTTDQLAHAGYCRLPPILPLGLGHGEVLVDVDGSGGLIYSITPT